MLTLTLLHPKLVLGDEPAFDAQAAMGASRLTAQLLGALFHILGSTQADQMGNVHGMDAAIRSKETR